MGQTEWGGAMPNLSPALDRIHTLIYTLLYPAFLGTFVTGMFQSPPSALSEWPWHWDHPPWSILFIFYFASQHIESIIIKHRYRWATAAADLLELFLMAVLFKRLGYLGDTPMLEWLEKIPLHLLAGLIFTVPTITGFLRWRSSRTEFYILPTTLAFAAAVSSATATEWAAFCILAIFVGVYLIFLQIGNEAIFKSGDPARRP